MRRNFTASYTYRPERGGALRVYHVSILLVKTLQELVSDFLEFSHEPQRRTFNGVKVCDNLVYAHTP